MLRIQELEHLDADGKSDCRSKAVVFAQKPLAACRHKGSHHDIMMSNGVRKEKKRKEKVYAVQQS